MDYKIARNALILATSAVAPIFCCEPNRGGCAVYGHDASRTEYREMQKEAPETAHLENVTIEDRIQ